jgi:hypothetical protein
MVYAGGDLLRAFGPSATAGGVRGGLAQYVKFASGDFHFRHLSGYAAAGQAGEKYFQ